MATSKLLEKYNELASKLGRPTLKSFKGKKAILEERIADMTAELAERGEEAPEAKPAEDKPKATKKAKAPKEERTDVCTVASVCREEKVNPKVVRARLRRLYEKGGEDLPVPVEGQWTFAIKDKERVRALVNPSTK